VLPSRSLKTNVTVPVGRSGMAPRIPTPSLCALIRDKPIAGASGYARRSRLEKPQAPRATPAIAISADAAMPPQS